MNIFERIRILLGWCPDRERINLEKNELLTENVFTFIAKSIGVFVVFILFAFVLRGIVLYSLVWKFEWLLYFPRFSDFLIALIVLSLFSSFFGFLGRSTSPKRTVFYATSIFIFLIFIVLILNYFIISDVHLITSWKTLPLIVKYIMRTADHEWIVPSSTQDWIIPYEPNYSKMILASVSSIAYAFVVSKWRSGTVLYFSSIVYVFLLPHWLETLDSMIPLLSVLINYYYDVEHAWTFLYGNLIILWVTLFDFLKNKVKKIIKPAFSASDNSLST